MAQTPMTLQLPAPSSVRWVSILLGGSVLYLLSAACVLYGLSQVLEPIYDRPEVYGQKFSCLGALNGYELALLAVALVIVLWKHVLDDAVSLTVLIAAFLVGSAIAIDVVAPDFAWPAVGIGAAGLVLAGIKGFAIDRWITGRWDRWMLPGLGLLLAWNFLMPGVMGVLGDDRSALELAHFWRIGWWVTLAGIVVLHVRLLMVPSCAFCQKLATPALRGAGLPWMLAGIVVAATFAHQYALLWAFNLPGRLGDFLPAGLLMNLLVLEMLRGGGWTSRPGQMVVAVAPLAAAMVVMGGRATQGPGWTLGVVSYPPAAVLGAGVLLLIAGAWRRRPVLTAAALVYFLFVILFWGQGLPQASRPLVVRNLNWLALGAALDVLIVVGAAVWRKPIVVAVAAVAVVVTGMWAYQHWGPSRAGWGPVVLGFALLALGAVVSVSKHRWQGRAIE